MWKTSSLNPKYEVNELGQVRHKIKKNILKGYTTKDGYTRFCMTDKNGIRKDLYAHVIVATEFCEGKTQNKIYVNHKNFNKKDNRAVNLEWVTHQENMEHWRLAQPFATQNEDLPEKRESKLNKGKCPVIQYDLNFNYLNEYESYMAAQRATGIRNGNISLCCQGKRHTAGGFIWRDKKESSTTIEKQNVKF